jgi:hypothetical protein
MDKATKNKIKYLFSPRYDKFRDMESIKIGPEGFLKKFTEEDIQPNILFLHWYERKFQTEVFINNRIIQNHITPFARNESLEDEIFTVFKSKLYSLSGKFSPIYFELEKQFPGIEKFEFEELFGWEFLEWLLESNSYNYVYHYVRIIKIENFQIGKTEDHDYGKRIEYRLGIPHININISRTLSPYFNFNIHGIWRECENEVRSKKNIPLIGEGWISETILYKKFVEYYPNLKIDSQGSPKWLKGQRYDIWIPDINVAIEYHGEQHRSPIKIFGGKEGLKKNITRDQEKKKKSNENNVDLIIIWHDEDLEKAFERTTELINSKLETLSKKSDSK